MFTHLMTRSRRIVPRATMLVAAGAALALSYPFVSPAAGATTTTSAATTTSTTPPPGSVAPGGHEVINGVTVGPAVVTTPGKPKRRLTADQNTAFLQTWMGASVVQHLPAERPPSCLPVSEMRSTNTYSGITSPLIVYYATDGSTVWVGMPKQSLSFGVVTKETWIRSPEPAISLPAFEGKVASVNLTTDHAPVAPPADPTATTVVCPGETVKTTPGTAATTKDTKSSSSSSTWVWIVIPAAVILGGLGVWLFMRSRTRTA